MNLAYQSKITNPKKTKQLLVSASCARVEGVLAAEQGGVPHAAVVGVHVDLGPHAAGLTALCARLHLRPHLHVLLHRCTQDRHTVGVAR